MIIIIIDNYYYLVKFIDMMVPSRRVRVSRIVYKRKILRLSPAILVGSSRSISLCCRFLAYEARILARSNER